MSLQNFIDLIQVAAISLLAVACMINSRAIRRATDPTARHWESRK